MHTAINKKETYNTLTGRNGILTCLQNEKKHQQVRMEIVKIMDILRKGVRLNEVRGTTV